MEKITTTIQLMETIRLLELKQKQEELILKEQFKTTYDSLKPSSLIKNTLKDLIATPNLKTNLLSTVLSIAAGYASKKIAVGDTKSPMKEILGSLLQMGVTSIVSNKSNNVVLGVTNVIKHYLFKKNEKV